MCRERSEKQFFKTECVPTTEIYHDTIEHDQFHVSIAEVRFDSCQEFHGHHTTAHLSYAFVSVPGGLAVWQLHKQTNKRTIV